MHPNTDDKDLRDLFATMRQEEARRAPAFDPFWDEALACAERRGVWMRYGAAALLIGVVLSAWLLLQPRQTPSITEWRSPTAGLLHPPVAMLNAGPLPTATLLALPAPRLEHYVPETHLFLPGDTLLDAASEQ